MVSNASVSRAAMAQFRYHLRSDGMTYQGAASVLHRLSAAEYASWYESQKPRSSISPGFYFQYFVGSSSRANNRSDWTALEMCRKHLMIVTLPSVMRFSKSLMAA